MTNKERFPEEVIAIKERLNKQGINYLLNVDPDHLGRMPALAADILRKVGEKIR